MSLFQSPNHLATARDASLSICAASVGRDVRHALACVEAGFEGSTQNTFPATEEGVLVGEGLVAPLPVFVVGAVAVSLLHAAIPSTSTSAAKPSLDMGLDRRCPETSRAPSQRYVCFCTPSLTSVARPA